MTSVGTIGRRACALLAAGSAALHAVMLDHTVNPIAGGLLAVMIAACLYCARELWRDGTVRAWVVVALMNLAMIALHVPAPAHHHGIAPGGPPSPSPLMTAATLLAFVEVSAAAVALYIGSRAVRLSGIPDRSAAGPLRRERRVPVRPG
jgi:hypothetical protein